MPSIFRYYENGRVVEFKHCSLFVCPPYKAPTRVRRATRHNPNPVEYGNNRMSFDIETTSFNIGNGKFACMYVWQFSLDGQYYWGRTWEEFSELLDKIKETWGLNWETRQSTIFVHNLAYEYSFMLKNSNFTWVDEFCRDKGKPMYTVESRGFRFQCSYIMSGYSLSNLAESIKCPVKKLKGDLDYYTLRHSKSHISKTEMHYCLNDVMILDYYIEKMLERYENIWEFPLTQTSVVRKYCQKKCLDYDPNFHFKIMGMQPNEYTYEMMKDCYQGGYTHANFLYVNEIIKDLAHIDFASSYPASLFRKLPMGAWRYRKDVDINFVQDLIYNKNKAIMMTVIIEDLEQTTHHSIISKSKCKQLIGGKVDNGRVWKADILKISITDYDWKLFKLFYRMGKVKVEEVYYCDYGFLPRPLIESILDFYEDKTKLKGVADKYDEYMHGKQNLNSIYGMMVTALVNEEVFFDVLNNEWSSAIVKSAKEQLEEYKNKWGTFLVWSWGVWCTAISRYNLLTVVHEMGDDAKYCDTDSIFYTNKEKYVDLINRYNNYNCRLIEECLDYYNIDHSRYKPKTIKGKEKTLGIFEYEEDIAEFCTKGAKKYMVKFYEPIKDGGKYTYYQMTVAGCNKIKGRDYLVNLAQEQKRSPLEIFCEGVEVPESDSGRLSALHCYDEFTCNMSDYNGIINEVHEDSYVYMEQSTYNLRDSEVQEFEDWLLNIRMDNPCATKFYQRGRE